MITIKAEKKSGLVSIKVEGHANYDEHGKDIVCSAVSAITQTALLGLLAIAESYPDHVKIVDIK